MSVKIRWLRKFDDQEERRKFAQKLQSDPEVLQVLRSIIEEEYKTALNEMTQDDKFDSNSWPYRQATYIAELKVLKTILELLRIE